MAKSPTAVPPAPPPPPTPVVEPTGTRDDPFLYSDGTPIVYNDGETEEAYRARVQKMIDDAAAAPQTQTFDPATGAAGVVGEDNSATQLNAANGGATAAAVAPTEPVIPSTVAEAQPAGAIPAGTPTPVSEDGTISTPFPSEYKTYDEYMAAQHALSNSVTAAHADAQPAAEPTLNEQQKAEQDYVDALDMDGRLRRVEAQLGLRSPTLVV
jgi:hypothetical protein